MADGSQAVLTEMDGRLHEAVVGCAPFRSWTLTQNLFPRSKAALGHNLHAIILNNVDAATDIIERLTKKQLGKAALLVPQLSASFQHSVRKVLPTNALAWAVDKVVAPRQLEPLVRHLFDGVVIFSTLGEALQAKKNDSSLAMATLAGEFVSAAGIVFGGSATTKSDSLLEREGGDCESGKESSKI